MTRDIGHRRYRGNDRALHAYWMNEASLWLRGRMRPYNGVSREMRIERFRECLAHAAACDV